MTPTGPTSGAEVPETSEVVSEFVDERLALLEEVRQELGIPENEVQNPPMSHAEMTQKFWETHDINNPEHVRILAQFTARFYPVQTA